MANNGAHKGHCNRVSRIVFPYPKKLQLLALDDPWIGPDNAELHRLDGCDR